MVIRVYISGNSGNKEIVTHQQRIFMILNSLGIPNEPVDISAPGMEKERDFMREKCKKKDGQRHALPPQIFNGEEYRGNFDDFDVANEDDVLEDFLGILKKDPAATTPTTTTTSDQPKPATDQSSTDKLGEEAMVTDESDKKESSPQETQPPPIAEVVPTSLPTDHEHKEEEPAIAEAVIEREEEEVKKLPRKSRTQQPQEELGLMWAPYQTRMVTQKGQVISTPKLITF